MHVFFLTKRAMGKCEQTALAKESSIVLILDRFIVRVWSKMREEFVVTVNLFRWRR